MIQRLQDRRSWTYKVFNTAVDTYQFQKNPFISELGDFFVKNNFWTSIFEPLYGFKLCTIFEDLTLIGFWNKNVYFEDLAFPRYCWESWQMKIDSYLAKKSDNYNFKKALVQLCTGNFPTALFLETMSWHFQRFCRNRAEHRVVT